MPTACAAGICSAISLPTSRGRSAARAGERARDLLGLDDEALALAVAPTDHRQRAAAAARRAEEGGAWPGGWSTCAHRAGLPPGLAALGPAGPRALSGTGDRELITALDPERAVTIVGARRAGAYGREVAFELGRTLAAAGIVVVSGMAIGIDCAAHEGALAGGGPTVAVLGPGAERAYPRSARGLYERIRGNGAVVSELPPGTPTFRWMFPARNRLMAALRRRHRRRRGGGAVGIADHRRDGGRSRPHSRRGPRPGQLVALERNEQAAGRRGGGDPRCPRRPRPAARPGCLDRRRRAGRR